MNYEQKIVCVRKFLEHASTNSGYLNHPLNIALQRFNSITEEYHRLKKENEELKAIIAKG